MQLSSRTSTALGTKISLLVLHEDRAVGEQALDDAFAELARVERVMSIYLAESQVSWLNAGGALPQPDPYLVRILHDAAEVSEQSAGAFDVTVQPLWTLYSEAQRRGQTPDAAALAAACREVSWRDVSVSPDRIAFRRRSMAITLNGIAQGFAADRVMEALKKRGIQHALVNTGEISSLGRRAQGDPWVVGIQHPRRPDAYFGLAALDGRCLSTSGDYETTFSPDFATNHIFDPATGRSPDSLASATVVAPTATLADALSTALFVLGPDRGLELAAQWPGVDVFLIRKDLTTLATKSFPWSHAAEAKS